MSDRMIRGAALSAMTSRGAEIPKRALAVELDVVPSRPRITTLGGIRHLDEQRLRVGVGLLFGVGAQTSNRLLDCLLVRSTVDGTQICYLMFAGDPECVGSLT
ncbi:MAG: hypothetical protein ACRDYA_05565 [Egibacteraceae bacterium]